MTSFLSSSIFKIFKTRNIYLLLLIFLAWGYPLLGFIGAVFSKIPIIGVLSPAVVPLLFIFLILCNLKKIVRCIKLQDIVFVLACVSLYLLSYIVYPRNSEYLDEYFVSFIFTILPFFFLGFVISFEEQYDIIYYTSQICFWILFCYVFVYIRNDNDYVTDDFVGMYYSYLILPYILVFIVDAIQRKRIVSFLTLPVALLYMLSLGSRGPILCVFVFTILYYMLLVHSKLKLVVTSLLAIIGFVLYSNVEAIALGLQSLLININMDTRIVDKVLGGADELLNPSGRDSILRIVGSYINESPFWGYGVAGDRVLVGTYSHNVAYEWWASFGLVIGSFFLLFTLLLVILAFINSNSLKEKAFVILLFISGFFKLLFSYTYLDEPLFFLLLGFCVQMLRKNNSAVTIKMNG